MHRRGQIEEVYREHSESLCQDTKQSRLVLQKYDRDQAPMDNPNEPHNIRTSVVQRETWHKGQHGWKLRKTEEILTGPVFFDGKIQQE